MHLASTIRFPSVTPGLRLLGQRLLEALHRQDLLALAGLHVTLEEYEAHRWPTLGEGRPGRSVPLDYAWRIHVGPSIAAAARALQRWGGRGLVLEGVEASLGVIEGDRFRLHRGFRMRAADSWGEPYLLEFAEAVLEREGRFKVYRYC
jgi:hypothetical protein